MMRHIWCSLVALALLLGSVASIAGPFDDVVADVKTGTVKAIDGDSPPLTGNEPSSTATFNGKISHFETIYNPVNGNTDCRATVTTEDGKTVIARFSDFPKADEGDPYFVIALQKQFALCLFAKDFYLNNQPLSVTGLMEPSTSATAPGLLSVQFIGPPSESKFTNGAARPEIVNFCNAATSTCTGTGVPIHINYSNNPMEICSVTLKVGSDDENFKIAAGSVQFRELWAKDPTVAVPLKSLRLLQSALESCQLLGSALRQQQPVTVFGRPLVEGFTVDTVVGDAVEGKPGDGKTGTGTSGSNATGTTTGTANPGTGGSGTAKPDSTVADAATTGEANEAAQPEAANSIKAATADNQAQAAEPSTSSAGGCSILNPKANATPGQSLLALLALAAVTPPLISGKERRDSVAK